MTDEQKREIDINAICDGRMSTHDLARVLLDAPERQVGVFVYGHRENSQFSQTPFQVIDTGREVVIGPISRDRFKFSDPVVKVLRSDPYSWELKERETKA